MNLQQLHHLKEELLNELDDKMERMIFRDEISRNEYYEARSEAIMAFFVKAMMEILDEETEVPSKKSA